MKVLNRSRSLKQFLIDLTPLLDVVFIMLIVVLAYQDSFIDGAEQMRTDARETVLEADDKVAEAEDRLATVTEQLDTYENMYDYVNVVTVYANYKPSNRKYRTLHVAINGGEQWEREINPSNEDRIWDECQTYIEATLSAYTGRPTVFAIMDEKMLYRDETAIIDLYNRLNITDKYEKDYTETDDE